MALGRIVSRFSMMILATVFLTGQVHAQQPEVLPTAKKSRKAKGRVSKPVISSEKATTPTETVEKSSGGPERVRESDDTLKFMTDEVAPAAAADQKQLKFNTGTTVPADDEKANSFSEEASDSVFKVYLGYPKHQVTVDLIPQQIYSKWSFSGQDFNFTSGSLAYGLGYRLVIDPTLSISLAGHMQSVGVAGSTIGSTFVVQDSDVTLTTIFANAEYCFIGSTSFYRQFCGALVIGRDAYPILGFSGSTSQLAMSKVEDLVIGPRLAIQIPIKTMARLRSELGYNFGNGIGNSGALTSKSNSSLTFNIGAFWTPAEHSELGLTGEYNMRQAKLSGQVGTNTVDWDTTSSSLMGRFSYTYTF